MIAFDSSSHRHAAEEVPADRTQNMARIHSNICLNSWTYAPSSDDSTLPELDVAARAWLSASEQAA